MKRFFLLLTLLFASPAFGAVAFVNSQHDVYASGSSATINFTPGGGSDFLVVKVIQYDIENNISGVTFNSIPMTLQITDNLDGSFGYHERVAIYTLVAPGTSAHDVVVSFSPNSSFGGDIISEAYSGVSSVTPVGNVAGKYKETPIITSPYTLALNINTGAMATAGIYINATTITMGAGQTEIHNGGDQDVGVERIGASYKAGASTDMSWAYTGSVTRGSIVAIEILPPAAVSATIRHRASSY